ncbi:MAG: carotenoid biosynthesis protein [Runella sp.]
MFTLISRLQNSPLAFRIFSIVLPLMHLAGFIGLQLPTSRPFFQTLVPFHLLSTALVLLLYHQDWNKSSVFFCVLAYVIGFGIEVLGVHTGLIFGHYQYGNTLGTKWLDVPLVIGLNWLVLIYAAGMVVASWRSSLWTKIALGAAVVVGLDFLIEPVAMRLDFWNWQGEVIPFQNYVAWYLISAFLLYCFYQYNFYKKNRLAGLLLLCQALFFTAHRLMYILD